jgi:predicted AlkP superfamily pyrophosphatase or phosphodiesterase
MLNIKLDYTLNLYVKKDKFMRSYHGLVQKLKFSNNAIILKIVLLFSLFSCNVNFIGNSKPNLHVVLIGLDGWGSYSLQNENHPHNMPYVRQLMSNGSYTLKNLCVMPSITAPNWESMFTAVTPDMHGIDQNPGNNRKPPLVSDEYGFFPSIFSVLKKQKPNAVIGYFYEKSERMEYLVPHEVMTKIAHLSNLSNNPQVILEDITCFFKDMQPELTGIIFQEPDFIGHKIGHNTVEYYSMLDILDKQIKRIVEATKNAGMFDNTIFILSADHGGISKRSGRDHGGDTPSEREIPFIIYGKNIKKGNIITSEVKIYDTAALIAHILGIQRPDIWKGRPVLEVFE